MNIQSLMTKHHSDLHIFHTGCIFPLMLLDRKLAIFDHGIPIVLKKRSGQKSSK